MSLARLAELERELAELQAEESAESKSSCSGGNVGSAEDSPLTSPWSRPDGEAADCRVPTLARLCVDNIGTNMHLYACLEGLPDFITEQLLKQFERHFSERHSKLHDGNISNWLDLAIEKRGCQGLGQLTVLNLRWSSRGITDAAIEVVAARCPGLRELDLGFCAAVGDGALAAIARGCASLRNVDLTACAAVSDAGVRSLALRKSLQSLSLELTSVTDVGVQAVVRGLPRLRCLNLGGCRHLSNVGVQIVASHGARLVRLSLGGCGSLLDFDVADLAKTCLGLQELVLRSCARLTDDAAKQIGLLLKRQNKRRARAAAEEEKDGGGGGAVGAPVGLRMLDVGGCKRISDAGLAQIALAAVHLHTLDVRGLRLTMAGMRAALPSMRQLHTLNVTGCEELGGATDAEVEQELQALCPTLTNVQV